MAKRNFVYFDLETRKSANDAGGWARKGNMGMTVGVTYSSATEDYRIYPESRVHELVEELTKADLVIGYNHIDFDFAVLEGYFPIYLNENCRSLDLFVEIEKASGVRVGLEAVATATLGVGKTAKGIDAIKWWQEGRYRDVAEYCCYDVKITRLVHEFGVREGHVRFLDRSGHEKIVEVSWEPA